MNDMEVKFAEYMGYMLYYTSSRVQIVSPNGHRWQHDYTSLSGAKAAIRADVRKNK